MPTAEFGIIALENNFFGKEKLIDEITKGILYAQVASHDKNADGGIRGLPGCPIEGENIYCWDTIYSLLFMNKLINQ
jgi:hypothetical protein